MTPLGSQRGEAVGGRGDQPRPHSDTPTLSTVNPIGQPAQGCLGARAVAMTTTAVSFVPDPTDSFQSPGKPPSPLDCQGRAGDCQVS